MSFGTRLKKLREEHGLTQQQLGEKSGISPRVLGYCEQDQRLNTAIMMISKLCKTLNTTADYLMLGNKKETKNYKSASSKTEFLNEREKTYKVEKYTQEELEILDYAKKNGIKTEQLINIIDAITCARQ